MIRNEKFQALPVLLDALETNHYQNPKTMKKQLIRFINEWIKRMF